MKKIPLSRGLFVLVDDEDFEELNQFKWSVMKSKDCFYAVRNFRISKGKKITILMHRQILKLTNPKILGEHRDGNGLNNQRYNLRISTHSENMRNTRPVKTGVSIYKGVSWAKKNNKWQVSIQVNKERIFLGLFVNEIEAAIAYDKAAKLHHGEFAWLNFKK